LLNLNNAQKHILLTFLTLWLTFHPIVSFFNCLQQNCFKYGRIVRTQAWRRFPHSLTAVSTMFYFRPIRTSPVTSWIYKHSRTSSGKHTAARQSNLVIDWLLGREIWIDRIYSSFSFISTRFAWSVFTDSARAEVRCGANLNNHSTASGVRNIWTKKYQNLIMFLQVMIDNVGDVFTFLHISMHISPGLHSLGSAEANIGWGGKLNVHLMASSVTNIHTRNY